MTTRGERASVGAEALAFGTLVLLAGTLVLLNVWSVVETRVAGDAAAREYLRAYTRATDREAALRHAELAARTTLAARGTPLEDLRIHPPDPAAFGPCGDARVLLVAAVPAARVPFLGTLGRTEVSVEHRELLDPYREVEPDARFDATSTPCAG